MRTIYPPTPGRPLIDHRRPVLTCGRLGLWTLGPQGTAEAGAGQPGRCRSGTADLGVMTTYRQKEQIR